MITSQEREIPVMDERGRPMMDGGRPVTLKEKVWNGTVASLTLMALGSSAPEILLNVVEVVGNGFYAGDLGPSTIVGSAAFNFLIIIAVCIAAIPDGEQRRIRSFSTFIVTTIFSLLAYSWMYVAISVWTPDIITLSEAAITALYLPLLVYFAYHADIGTFGGNDHAVAEAVMAESDVPPLAHGVVAAAGQSTGGRSKRISMRASFNEFDQATENDRLIAQMKVVRATHDPRGELTNQQIADIAAVDIGLVDQKSIAFYRNLSGRHAKQTKFVSRKSVKRLTKTLRKGAKYAHKGVQFIFPTVGYDDFILEEQLKQQQAAAAKKEEKAKKKALKAAAKPPRRPSWWSGRRAADGTQQQPATQPPPAGQPPAAASASARARAMSATPPRGDPELALLGQAAVRSDEGADDELLIVAVDVPAPGKEEEEELSCMAQYQERVRDSLQLMPDPDEDSVDADGTPLPPDCLTIVLHVIAIPWRLIAAALIPPPEVLGGAPAFFTSLMLIGLTTAFISDLAGILGCVVGVPDPITAVTLVALGTSLPDTFASKIAAENEPTADSSITNVTGSNSVNVFVGLGLPWLFASLYWSLHGPNEAWVARYPGVAMRMPEGTAAYVVIGGDLGFSVSAFCIVCILGVFLIFYRRFVLGAELGGTKRAKWASAAMLVSMWVIFIVIVCLKFSGAV